MADQVRVPPHSSEAESSVLGALLLDKDAIIAVAEFLEGSDFYDERHKQIYEAILSLFEERIPVDVLTVTQRLKKKKVLKNVGGAAYLSQLTNRVPTAAHVEHYGKIVRDTAIKRALMSAATRLVDFSMDEGLTAADLMDKAESEVFALSQKNISKAFTSVKDTLAESFDRLDELHKQGEGLRGVPTGFKDLDSALAGFQKSNLIILAARPGVGKCVTGDTLIIDPETGKRQKIQDLVSEKKGGVLSLNEKFRLEKSKPSVFVDDGKKYVYEIETMLGNKLQATAVHPLLTIDGWKKVEDLKKGDRVAVPRELNCFGREKWDDWKIKCLAYFLGEKVEKIDRTNNVSLWLENLGVMGKLAIHKEIPQEIFSLIKKDIGLFLNRIYACDGSVILPVVKGSGRISYSSSSYKLAEQIKHLLLRFGILSRLRRKKIKYKGDYNIAYEIEIMGAGNILKFVQEIGIFGKEKKLKKIVKIAFSKKDSNNWTKDTLPMGVWKIILEEKGDLSWRRVYQMMGRPLSHNIHVNARQPRRETVKDIAKALGSKKLLNLATSDVYWDRIVSIKPMGLKHVYDLTVDKLHNFVAGDIVVHNTAMALGFAQHLAVKEKKAVGFFSLEMSKEELVDRLLVAQADIDAWKLKTGKLSESDFTKLSNAMGELAEAPLFIDDTPAMSILEMRTKARRLQVDNGVDLLIVDYLQLARSRGLENRVQEVTEIAEGLKNLARELKVPVIALSQLSRGIEQRGVKRPQLSDLRDSGGIEQAADVVMFLWREDDEKMEIFKLDIAKHRNGPLASVPLFFKGDRIKFFPRDTKH